MSLLATPYKTHADRTLKNTIAIQSAERFTNQDQDIGAAPAAGGAEMPVTRGAFVFSMDMRGSPAQCHTRLVCQKAGRRQGTIESNPRKSNQLWPLCMSRAEATATTAKKITTKTPQLPASYELIEQHIGLHFILNGYEAVSVSATFLSN